jgi:hypothetical protein
MEYILTPHGIDFDAYFAYLVTVRDRMSEHVAAFAADPRHHSLTDRESLHDAWVDSVVVREDARGTRGEARSTAVEITLLGPFHDRIHVLRYAAVRRYELVGSAVVAGHGDVYAHEVRLAHDGVSIEHELLFDDRPGRPAARMLIECADLTHEMIVIQRGAG